MDGTRTGTVGAQMSAGCGNDPRGGCRPSRDPGSNASHRVVISRQCAAIAQLGCWSDWLSGCDRRCRKQWRDVSRLARHLLVPNHVTASQSPQLGDIACPFV